MHRNYKKADNFTKSRFFRTFVRITFEFEK